MQDVLVPARFLQLLGVAIVCGSSLFFLYGWRPGGERWPRGLVAVSALVAAGAAGAWLLAQAANLGDGSFDPEVLAGVALQTQFGLAAVLRLGVMLLAAGLALQRPAWRPLAICGAIAVGSLAWTGHGAADDGLRGLVHQGADIVHLLAAAIWIGALPPLAVLLFRGGESEAAEVGLSRFSGIGPAVVAAVLASGLVNSWFLIGPSQALSLTDTPYGRLLAVKLVLVAGMLGIAGLNRWALTPRLAADPTDRGLLRLSLVGETVLAVGVLVLVAALGVLDPPMGG